MSVTCKTYLSQISFFAFLRNNKEINNITSVTLIIEDEKYKMYPDKYPNSNPNVPLQYSFVISRKRSVIDVYLLT